MQVTYPADLPKVSPVWILALFNLEGTHRTPKVGMGPELSWLERTTDNRKVGGSSPLGPTIRRYGGLAQLGERLICIQEVSGSIPLFSTTASAEAAP